jgi:outer membrane cobalamin receptor
MASGHFDLANVQLSANATYFHTRVKDEILWLVNGQNTSSPYNLGPIVTKGVELRAKAGTTLWGLSIDAEESYTFLDTRVFDAEFYDKEVPYSTPTTSLCTIDIGRHDLGAMVATVRYHGHRYGDPGNSEGRRIEPATLVDASYDAPGWLLTSIAFHMRLSVVNIFDVQESEFPGYPLPGRTLSLTTSLTY